MIAALKVTHQEKRKTQVMKRELAKLKEELAKLKGMVHLTVASLNLQNHGVPTEDLQDVFDSQIMEESLEEEEIPQENVVAIPIPGLSMEILWTLQEIPPSLSPLLCLPVGTCYHCVFHSTIGIFSSATVFAHQRFNCGSWSNGGGVQRGSGS